MNMGQTRWYKKVKKDATYAIALDPIWGQAETMRLYRYLNYPPMNK